MDRIKRIDRQLAYKGSILDIYSDTIETPEGKISHYDHIHHPGAAAVIPVLDDGRLVLVRQYRNSLDRFTLEIPAGGIEAGEETIKSASRELEEETGYRCGQIKPFISIITAVAFCNEVVDVFLATQLTKSEQHLDPDEYINVEAYTTDELSRMIFAGEIQDSKTVSAVMAYLEYIRRN
jgi:ADP-ribose pyrophosphatase